MTEQITLRNKQGKRKYLTPEERLTFIKTASLHPNRKIRSLALTLAQTGGRISEIIALTPGRVDFEAQQIVLLSLKKRVGTPSRAITVPPDLLTTLDLVHGLRELQGRTPEAEELEQPIWPIHRQTAWRYISQIMADAGITGAHANPKGLRHSFAITALMRDVPIPLVQRWLGHSRMETTAIYLQVAGKEERQLAERMWT